MSKRIMNNVILQARIQHPDSRVNAYHQDLSGVNGLRFLCGTEDDSEQSFFEFPGSIGQWLPQLKCPHHAPFVTSIWVKDSSRRDLLDISDNLGVIDVRIKCGTDTYKDYSSYSYTDYPGRETVWRNLNVDSSCGQGGKDSVMAVRVKAEKEPEETVGESLLPPNDHFGITVIQYTCDYYSE